MAAVVQPGTTYFAALLCGAQRVNFRMLYACATKMHRKIMYALALLRHNAVGIKLQFNYLEMQ